MNVDKLNINKKIYTNVNKYVHFRNTLSYESTYFRNYHERKSSSSCITQLHPFLKFRHLPRSLCMYLYTYTFTYNFTYFLKYK